MELLYAAACAVAALFGAGILLRPNKSRLSATAAALLFVTAVILGIAALRRRGGDFLESPDPRLGALALLSALAFSLSLSVTKIETERRRLGRYPFLLVVPALLADFGRLADGFPRAATPAFEALAVVGVVLCGALSIVHVFRYHFPHDMTAFAWTVLGASAAAWAALSMGTAGMILADDSLTGGMDAILSVIVLAGALHSFRGPGAAERFRSETVTRRYARSVLSGMEIPELISGLDTLMRRTGLYLRPDCSLDELARRMGLTRHQVSELLNDRMGTSFAAFVNGFRVEAAKDLLASRPELTVLSIALEVGFGNKTSFNEAFRKATGSTPTEYRRILVKRDNS